MSQLCSLTVRSFASFKDEYNIVIPTNKLTVICGPNGFGKSNILKALEHLIYPQLDPSSNNNIKYTNGSHIKNIQTNDTYVSAEIIDEHTRTQQLSILTTCGPPVLAINKIKASEFQYNSLIKSLKYNDEWRFFCFIKQNSIPDKIRFIENNLSNIIFSLLNLNDEREKYAEYNRLKRDHLEKMKVLEKEYKAARQELSALELKNKEHAAYLRSVNNVKTQRIEMYKLKSHLLQNKLRTIQTDKQALENNCNDIENKLTQIRSQLFLKDDVATLDLQCQQLQNDINKINERRCITNHNNNTSNYTDNKELQNATQAAFEQVNEFLSLFNQQCKAQLDYPNGSIDYVTEPSNKNTCSIGPEFILSSTQQLFKPRINCTDAEDNNTPTEDNHCTSLIASIKARTLEINNIVREQLLANTAVNELENTIKVLLTNVNELCSNSKMDCTSIATLKQLCISCNSLKKNLSRLIHINKIKTKDSSDETVKSQRADKREGSVNKMCDFLASYFNSDVVLGPMRDLFRVKNSKYLAPIESFLENIMNSIVVRDYKTACTAIDLLKSQTKHPINILYLSGSSHNHMSTIDKMQLETFKNSFNNVELASDVIKSDDPLVQSYLEQRLNKVVIALKAKTSDIMEYTKHNYLEFTILLASGVIIQPCGLVIFNTLNVSGNRVNRKNIKPSLHTIEIGARLKLHNDSEAVINKIDYLQSEVQELISRLSKSENIMNCESNGQTNCVTDSINDATRHECTTLTNRTSNGRSPNCFNPSIKHIECSSLRFLRDSTFLVDIIRLTSNKNHRLELLRLKSKLYDSATNFNITACVTLLKELLNFLTIINKSFNPVQNNSTLLATCVVNKPTSKSSCDNSDYLDEQLDSIMEDKLNQLNSTKAKIEEYNKQLQAIYSEETELLKIKYQLESEKISVNSKIEDLTSKKHALEYEMHIHNIDYSDFDKVNQCLITKEATITKLIESYAETIKDLENRLINVHATLVVPDDLELMKVRVNELKEKINVASAQHAQAIPKSTRNCQDCSQKVTNFITAVNMKLAKLCSFLEKNVDCSYTKIVARLQFMTPGESNCFLNDIKYVFGQTKKRNKKLSALSGGEQVIAFCFLALAIKNIMGWDLLLADEIDSSLDGLNVQAISQLLLNEKGQKIVISFKTT